MILFGNIVIIFIRLTISMIVVLNIPNIKVTDFNDLNIKEKMKDNVGQ